MKKCKIKTMYLNWLMITSNFMFKTLQNVNHEKNVKSYTILALMIMIH